MPRCVEAQRISVCPVCGQTIRPGDVICRPGGPAWMHQDCAAGYVAERRDEGAA